MNINNHHVWKKSPLLWAVDNKLKNEKGTLLEFVDRSFLKDPIDDFSPLQAYNKASQIGFSTMMILKSFNASFYRDWNIIYTLPTGGDVGNFVSSKVNPIIQNNPILANWVKDKDTIEQKKVGKSFIYYRGTATSKSEREKSQGGIGIILSSDWNIHDECDRSDQVALEQYESRLANSSFKGRCYFSNPTHPKTLNQELYEKSDQKEWFVKCEHCNEWQYLDFWENILLGQYVCSKCHGDISNESRKSGNWVARYRDKEISGYHISHLMCPWISAKEVQNAFETKTKSYFYNFVLGLPYVGSDILVNADLILKCVDTETVSNKERAAMGVDVGLTKHYVIGNHQGVFAVGTTNSWEDIDKMIRMYDVECCVIDAMPDQTKPRELRDKYPGKVWLSWFKREIKKAEYIQWDNVSRSVYSDRTNAIDEVINSLVERKIRFQIDPKELGSYIRHWGTLFKTKDTDNLGIERDVWESRGEDHFVFAQVYQQIALSRVGQGESKAFTYKPFTSSAPFGYGPDLNELAARQ